MTILTQPVARAPNTGSETLRRAFRAEERASLRLATRARLVSLLAIGVLLTVVEQFPQVLFYEGVLVVFAALGVAQDRLARSSAHREWHAFVFVALDFALLAFTVLQHNPLRSVPWPEQIMLRGHSVIYFFFLIAATAFSYVPKVTLWAGVCAATAFGVGAGRLALMPDTLSFIGPPENMDAALDMYTDARFVDLNSLIQDVVMMLVTAGVLAVVVHRSRRLVERQAAAARERANLARHFSPRMVDHLAARDDPLGEVRSHNVAVLFADIVGFTRIAEASGPHQSIALLRDFHRRLAECVFRHDGALDKFLGDGLMATFGTPDAGPDDAGRALACAADMLAAIDAWNTQRRDAGEAEIRLSIGLHYGPVVLGDIGSERRLEFAVIGDVVNVASRLEALTRRLDCRIAASDALREAAVVEGAGDVAEALRPMPAQTLPGRSGEIAVWVG